MVTRLGYYLFGFLVLGLSVTACSTKPETTSGSESVAETAVTPNSLLTATTPAPMCTPPPCLENEIYFCADGCPNGCGIVCATTTPEPPLTEVEELPATWNQLELWLTEAWHEKDIDEVQTQLQELGWILFIDEIATVDINNDGQTEWVLTLYPLAEGPDKVAVFIANLWVVGKDGVIFKYYEKEDKIGSGTLRIPYLLDAVDMTGNKNPELIIVYETCGAHTCFGYYQILHYENDSFENIILGRYSSDLPEFDTIHMSYPDIYFADYDQDGLQDFFIHGGSIGSAGAGIQRKITEVWSWDGNAVTRNDWFFDSTQYNHHILYEANWNFLYADAPPFNKATELYEQLINDDSLLTPDTFNGQPKEDLKAAIKEFATFRLILIDLLNGDQVQAKEKLLWLENNYTNTPITNAAQFLLINWQEGDSPFIYCDEITKMLRKADNPTGPLVNLGYGNPQLMAESVCPKPNNVE